VLKNYELYKLQYSKIKRVLKAPFKTIPYFIMTWFAYKHPFKVNYTTFWGDRMSFFLPEANAIYYYGFFEANLTNFYLNFIQEGDIFFDVGAHVGYYTILNSSLVGETGQVHSFEPTPRTFKTLKENSLRKNNITVNNNAVLDTETEIEFVDYGPKYSAFNSFQKRTGEQMAFLSRPEKLKVKTISLDKYSFDRHVTPTIIKIDAEGAEYLILQAMINIIQNKKPIISIEVAGEEEWKDNCSKSIKLLEDNGYVAYEIDLNGYVKKHIQQETYLYDNLLFVHPDNMSRLQSLIR
jgi:FkbM family methyltransferase